jgi:hypothetical protein
MVCWWVLVHSGPVTGYILSMKAREVKVLVSVPLNLQRKCETEKSAQIWWSIWGGTKLELSLIFGTRTQIEYKTGSGSATRLATQTQF